jgi:hypothetical protein
LLTLLGVIWFSAEKRVPPRSPPQCSQLNADPLGHEYQKNNNGAKPGADGSQKPLHGFPEGA